MAETKKNEEMIQKKQEKNREKLNKEEQRKENCEKEILDKQNKRGRERMVRGY